MVKGKDMLALIAVGAGVYLLTQHFRKIPGVEDEQKLSVPNNFTTTSPQTGQVSETNILTHAQARAAVEAFFQAEGFTNPFRVREWVENQAKLGTNRTTFDGRSVEILVPAPMATMRVDGTRNYEISRELFQ